MQPDVAEVLILNLRTAKYTFPEFLKKMRKLKVLIVTNYGSHHSKLNKFELLGSSSDLKRIRLEKVSVPSLCKMKNLQKLSLYMCNVNQAFQSCTIQISAALPNLVEISIDYCNDLVELPAGFSDIKPLKKLNITNCHMFAALPEDTGNLENLEVLRLSSCTDLEELPASITRLLKLTFLDISDCINLSKLPDNIGDLRNLRKICMSMGAYSRLREVPNSVWDLVELKHVICDRETAALWDDIGLPNVEIEVPTVDNNLNWLYGGSL